MNKPKNSWKGFLEPHDEEKIKELIPWLYKGYKKYGDNKHAEHFFYLVIRDITRVIGEFKNLSISEKAEAILGEHPDDMQSLLSLLKKHPKKIKREHIKPARFFVKEFETRRKENRQFTAEDAERWFKEAKMAAITKEEDDRLTAKGWRGERPDDAYKQLGIKLKPITRKK
jgi:hypothetical protein